MPAGDDRWPSSPPPRAAVRKHHSRGGVRERPCGIFGRCVRVHPELACLEARSVGTMTFDDFAFAGISFMAELNDGSSSLLSIPSDPFFWDDQGFGFASQTLAYNATLGPGDYQLVLDVDPFGGNGQGAFDFTFTLVPEPGTALLLASGLVAVAARRRKA